ncbi:Serine/threonine-protein kinase PknD [Actinomadura rubteroloni]|uniref:non-specific serine/threonine protein kinase n=1 Tax=Actinomadura rubteroloni TaxID=1926885 RepID=A0A2P4UKH5_9ACTN|nr:serine/threonine-protein kinase [Actinomadura rubteroloni]POM25540.1 Serine/threonine-protein kinase PknD [Actinomadura rubteroloni]
MIVPWEEYEMSGWRIAGYTELRELGAGAQGRVVLARDDASGHPVAVKYLAADAGADDRERLRHEAQMLARAESPHIARPYRLVESDAGAALVMEAVDGVSLKTLLAEHGALGPEAALSVLKGSLLGLAAAHAVGVVHRDFKPANIVVPADGRSRLVDFGIAVPAGRATGGAGTPAYMAPEQWTRHQATPATDVYAATCVFVECASGARPFGGDLAELRAAHLTAPAPVERVPAPLRPLVATGMAKDPADRPAGTAAFVDELEHAARAAYGDDWEQRGVRALAGASAALAALFPLAAWLAGGGAAGAAGAGAGAAGAGAGAGAAALGKTAAAAGTAKGFMGGIAGIAAATVGTAAVVGAGAVIVVRAGGDDPKPRSVSASPVALVKPVGCRTGESPSEPAGSSTPPATVRLPRHVTLPAGTAVYYTQDKQLVVGPAGARCEKFQGAANSSVNIGPDSMHMVSVFNVASYGSIMDAQCAYFPDSPEAAKARRERPDCGWRPRTSEKLPGTKVRATLTTEPPNGTTPGGPFTSATLATMAGGLPVSLTCAMPYDRRNVCVAAFTHWYAQAATPADADLDTAARQIAAFVARARYA